MYNINAFPTDHLLEYYKWVGTNKNKAIALCTLNVDVSESLYPALYIFEVTLRNSINSSFVDYYGLDWHFQGLVKYKLESVRKKVAPKKSKFKKHYTSESALNCEIVATMNLFYWTNILDPINSHLWSEKGVKPIFSSNIGIDKSEIFIKANELRKLRNRIAHLKSIIQRNLRSNYEDCREILALLSKDALTWCDSKSRFLDVHPNDVIIKNDLLSPNLDLTPWMQFNKINEEQNNLRRTMQ